MVLLTEGFVRSRRTDPHGSADRPRTAPALTGRTWCQGREMQGSGCVMCRGRSVRVARVRQQITQAGSLDPEMEREIVVKGHGRVRAMPDRAAIQVVIDAEAATRE